MHSTISLNNFRLATSTSSEVLLVLSFKESPISGSYYPNGYWLSSLQTANIPFVTLYLGYLDFWSWSDNFASETIFPQRPALHNIFIHASYIFIRIKIPCIMQRKVFKNKRKL